MPDKNDTDSQDRSFVWHPSGAKILKDTANGPPNCSSKRTELRGTKRLDPPKNKLKLFCNDSQSLERVCIFKAISFINLCCFALCFSREEWTQATPCNGSRLPGGSETTSLTSHTQGGGESGATFLHAWEAKFECPLLARKWNEYFDFQSWRPQREVPLPHFLCLERITQKLLIWKGRLCFPGDSQLDFTQLGQQGRQLPHCWPSLRFVAGAMWYCARRHRLNSENRTRKLSETYLALGWE